MCTWRSRSSHGAAWDVCVCVHVHVTYIHTHTHRHETHRIVFVQRKMSIISHADAHAQLGRALIQHNTTEPVCHKRTKIRWWTPNFTCNTLKPAAVGCLNELQIAHSTTPEHMAGANSCLSCCFVPLDAEPCNVWRARDVRGRDPHRLRRLPGCTRRLRWSRCFL